jgi:protease-4
MHSELQKFKQNKPVVVVIEDHCYSAAYAVACAASYIFAQSGSELGSIGVIMTIEKYKNAKMHDKNMSADMDITLVRGGNYKDLGNPNLPLCDWHIKDFKKRNNLLYQAFIKMVAQARNLSIDNEKQWADGKIFSAQEAIDLGLIDAIGDFSDAIVKMKELLQARGITIDTEFELVDVTQKPA